MTVKSNYKTRLLLIFIVCGLLPLPVFAIPSPDLLISAGASIGQLLGLLAASFGGLGFSLRKKMNASAGKASPWPFRITLICFFVTAGLFALYYGEQVDKDNKRLQTNLVRPSVEAGKKVGDVSLKTLSFSQQLNNPLGISTDQVSEWLKEGKQLNIIDIREPEEIEYGHIPGAWHRRYPDLKINQSGVNVKGAKTILVCFSGNRSGETAQELSDKGFDIAFMVGGNQKWIAEGRSLENYIDRNGVLRSLAPYPNDKVLLDTLEVEGLLHEENAVPIDVRYEKDFELSHLPGAINMPLRKMLSIDMADTFEKLPKDRPLFSPCYDKRSCFYSEILGLRLTRHGLDYRGRYTVPHEYMALPKNQKGYVKDWSQQQQGASLFGLIGKPIEAVLYWFEKKTGSILWAILLTVALLRIVFFPFTVKNEIDNIKGKMREPQIKTLKQKLKNEPKRLSRALQKISKSDKNTPLINLIGTMGQITFFIVLFSVISNVAEKFSSVTFLTMSISDKDPVYLMPLVVTGLIYLLMHLSSPDASIKKRWFYVACSGVIFLLTFQISVALNIYLIASIAIMITHNYLVKFFYHRSQNNNTGNRKKFNKSMQGIVTFQNLLPESGGGGKAENLGELIRAGFPVPGGFAITNELLNKKIFSEEDKIKLKAAWDELGAEKVAVRSSGLNEDADDRSCAGIYESVLNVTWDDFYDAIDEVKDSFSSIRAESYIDEQETPGIAVQKMIDAEYAGVFFREDPTTSGSSIIEMVEGLGESLVSGEVTPLSFRYGRYSDQPMFEGEPPIDLTPLLAMGKKVEAHYGHLPQDIEFAYKDGQFYLLQTRAITMNSRQNNHQKAFIERERHRLCEMFKDQPDGEVVLTQDALCELVPKPTPLTLSLINKLWEPGGTVSLACEVLGFPYDADENAAPYAVTAFGDLYVNQVEKRKRTAKGPGAIAAFQLSRAAEKIEEEFRDEFLPGLLQRTRIRQAIDFTRLSLSELSMLCEEWVEQFVKETYLQAEIINIAAEYYTQMARKELEKHGENAIEELSHIPETAVSRAMALLPLIKEGSREIQEFIDQFGHRCRFDFELGMSSYSSDPDAVDILVENSVSNEKRDFSHVRKFDNKVLDTAVTRSIKFQALKEEAKHNALLEYRLLRPLLVEIGEHLGLPENGVFQLSIDEVFRLTDANFVNEVDTLVKHRIKESKYYDRSTPLDFTLSALEIFDLDVNLSVTDSKDSRMLSGLRISGQGEAAGRARVISNPDEINIFQKGEILVARTTDPTWTPIFSLASGVISDIGGMLSHAAIVARELNLPGIVDVRNATSTIKTGDLVRLLEDGTVEIDEKTRRSAIRFPLNRSITMKTGEDLVDITIEDISLCGALISATTKTLDHLDYQTTGSFELDEEHHSLDFTIVRRDNRHCELQFVKQLMPEAMKKFMRRDKERYEVNNEIELMWGDRKLDALLLNISSESALIRVSPEMLDKVDCMNTGCFHLGEKYREIEFKAAQRNKGYFVLHFSKMIGKKRLTDYSEYIYNLAVNN